MKDNNISEDLANDLIKSLNNFNLPYEFFDAIYGEKIEEVWIKKNLQFLQKQNANKKLPGVKGCFLSHFSLWEECVNTNTPYLIFEHDALMLRPFPKDILDYNYDVLNLDFASREIPDYNAHCEKDYGFEIRDWPLAPKRKGWFSRASKSSIKGLHAYIVKPQGATKLIEAAYEYGTIPADVHVNSMYVDLKFTTTSYFRVNPKYWIDAKTGSSNSFTRAKE